MSASGPAIVATTRLVSASFPSIASQMQIANGCYQQNMVALVASQSSQESLSKSRTLRSVLVSRRKVMPLYHLLSLTLYTNIAYSNQQTHGHRQGRSARPALHSRSANHFEPSTPAATLPSARAQRHPRQQCHWRCSCCSWIWFPVLWRAKWFPISAWICHARDYASAAPATWSHLKILKAASSFD